jgi:hypothetical protein
MQVRSLITAAFAVATLASGAAFAQTTPYGQEGGQTQSAASGRTRADVQGELVQFRTDHPVSPWSMRYDPLTTFQSTATRADVTAAYIADRAEVEALTGEDSGSAYMAQVGMKSAPAEPNLASNGAAAQIR